MGVFIIYPNNPGLSSITCALAENAGTVDYQVVPSSVDIHEEERFKIAYAEVEGGGRVRKTLRSLAPFEFNLVVYGDTVALANTNARTIFRVLTDPQGGRIGYRPAGFPDTAMVTYYHYLQSPAPRRARGFGNYTTQQANRAVTDEPIAYHVQLTTLAWGMSDVTTLATILGATSVDNEGASAIVPNSAIKGDAVLPVINLTGAMTSNDDVLQDVVLYTRKMRDDSNTNLDWIEAEDTSSESSAYPYNVFCAVKWRSPYAATRYPTDIVANTFDTATLVSGSKMQADGDDLRVFNGGTEIDRWLQDINNATTQVWCNLDFAAAVSMTLASALTTTTTSVVVNESIDDMPDSGILQIESEIVLYSAKNDASKAFTVSSRGAYGSTAATHTADTATYWVQHNLWIRYGNGTATAPTTNDDYKPIFSLASTNAAWTYADFGTTLGLRSGSWSRSGGNTVFYTANHKTDASPWEEMGMTKQADGASSMLYLYNPCTISNMNITNGEKYATDTIGTHYIAVMSSDDISSWSEEYELADISSPDSWESWSRDEAVANKLYVGICLNVTLSSSSTLYSVEFADAVTTMNSSYTPTVSMFAEMYTNSTEVADGSASGDAYMTYGAVETNSLEIGAANFSGMDSTYFGKVTPIVIARCSVTDSWRLRWKVYVGAATTPVQMGQWVTLTGSVYWKCLYNFSELDFPPFQIPETVAEADVDAFIDSVSVMLEMQRLSGSGNIDVDVICLAKADQWISHVYNAKDTTGIQTSSGDTLVIDAVTAMCRSRDSSDDVVQIWNQEGVPLEDLVLEKGFDHRLRFFGFKDQTTLKYTPIYDMSVAISGIYLTIAPFEEAA